MVTSCDPNGTSCRKKHCSPVVYPENSSNQKHNGEALGNFLFAEGEILSGIVSRRKIFLIMELFITF